MRMGLAMLCVLAATASAKTDDKVGITTSSEDARKLYLQARDLAEKLRNTDAHELYKQAVSKDPSFALAYLGIANTSTSTAEFFDAVAHAVAVVDKVSPGEQLIVRAADAAGKADPVHQKELLDKLAKQFPSDERVHNLLGAYYFGRLDYPNAIASYEKAIKLAPSFTQPYNQLGYAYRFANRLADAERTFKKYIELIPDDPNPYDSYAELLMQEGKFDESIASYKKALAVQPTFVNAYAGIGNDLVFEGKHEEARKTYAELTKTARNTGEKRFALFWSAFSYADEGAWDKAIAELDKMTALSAAEKDLGTVSGDANTEGNVLLEAGRPDAALAKFKATVEISEKSEVPESVKVTVRRNLMFDEARVLLAKHDLAAAKAKSAAYAKAVDTHRPFEVRQQHELAGMIALEEKQFAVAIKELAQANQRDPRILYLTALAQQGAGNAKAAKSFASQAANFNGFAPNLAFVRAKAKALAGAS